MKLFLFKSVANLTDHYHSGGGLVIIAENRESAQAMFNGYVIGLGEGHAIKQIRIDQKEWSEVIEFELKLVKKPRLFIFPDKGCC